MKPHAFNVQSHSTTLLPNNIVQIAYTNDGKTPAFDQTLTPEQIRDPINGFGEFLHGQATLDKLSVILSFERKLLNTPVEIYLDKSPGFQPYLARNLLPMRAYEELANNPYQLRAIRNDEQPATSEPQPDQDDQLDAIEWAYRQLDAIDPLRDPHLQSPTEPQTYQTLYQNYFSDRRPRVEHRLTCGNAGTPTTAVLVRDRYSGNIRLEITIDENWDWRVDRLSLPSVGSHQSEIAEAEFMGIYRDSQLAQTQALMRCAYVYDATWSTMPNDRGMEIANAALDIYSPVQLRYAWYLGTPRSGWVEIARTGSETWLNNGKEFNRKLTDVPPEIAADMFEENDEPELANALRLQSGMFKKLGLNG